MKDLKISRELLSEVLGHDDMCNERVIQNKLLYMCKNDGMGDYEYEYNIYEFSFKCKEWASNLRYQIISGPSDEQAYRKKSEQAYSEVLWYEGDDVHRTYKNELFLACSEPEAIIKACEWVINKEIKG